MIRMAKDYSSGAARRVKIDGRAILVSACPRQYAEDELTSRRTARVFNKAAHRLGPIAAQRRRSQDQVIDETGFADARRARDDHRSIELFPRLESFGIDGGNVFDFDSRRALDDRASGVCQL